MLHINNYHLFFDAVVAILIVGIFTNTFREAWRLLITESYDPEFCDIGMLCRWIALGGSVFCMGGFFIGPALFMVGSARHTVKSGHTVRYF